MLIFPPLNIWTRFFRESTVRQILVHTECSTVGQRTLSVVRNVEVYPPVLTWYLSVYGTFSRSQPLPDGFSVKMVGLKLNSVASMAYLRHTDTPAGVKVHNSR